MVIFKCLNSYFLVIVLKSVYSQTNCGYIKQVEVKVNEFCFNCGRHYVIFINGCLQDNKFPNQNTNDITVTCKSTEITRLEKHSIRHLEALEGLYILNCPISRIEPEALTDLPILEVFILNNASLSEIRQGVFGEIPSFRELHLKNNKIEFIEDNAFSNLRNLSIVDLSNNELKYMSSKWFINSTNLYLFNISHNFLTRIRSETFRHVPQLLSLYLNHNHISVIEADAFKGILKLDLLKLNNNWLTSLSPDIFPNDFRIKFFKLDDNYIQYVSEAFLEKTILNHMIKYHMTLAGNPFKCPCLNRLHRWLLRNQKQINGTEVVWTFDRYDADSCQRSHGNSFPFCVADTYSPNKCTEIVHKDLIEKFLKTTRNICPNKEANSAIMQL